MGRPFTFSLSSLCLLLLASACFATSSSRLNQCQLNNLNALEPDNRVESDGGLIETWNSQHPELECTGVTVSKRTLYRNGLHLPSYSPYPQMIIIVQGEGAIGYAFPGCPETFEEPRQQSGRRRGSSRLQQLQDSHQKIRHFNQGDVLLIPPGVPYWTYNTGDEPVVAISLLDTSNLNNQLDQTPRVFYLAGNPDVEHPETLQQMQHQKKSAGGRKHGQHQQQDEDEEEEEEEGGSVLSGFSKHFLSQSFNTNEEIAEKLQSQDDERKQIVKVKGGLSVISPKWQEQQEEDEDEDEDEPQHHHSQRPSHEKHEDEDEDEEKEEKEKDQPQPQPRHGGKGHKEEEEQEEDEEEEPRHKTREWRWKKTRPGKQEEGEACEDEWKTIPSKRNGIEENICTLKLHENIARPSRADFYNPRAGRISTLNSLTLPVLRQFGLSAQYVVLYKNGIYAPHWNLNANSVIYVTRGEGKVRVVNCQGNAVFEGKLSKGQLLVVPQNFVVAEQAGEQGFEYVVFKTNHNAVTSYLKEVFRAIPSEVLANSYNLRQSQVHDLKYEGNLGPLVNPESHHQS